MKKIRIDFIFQFLLFVFVVPSVFSQKRTKWLIVNAVTTFTQIGVVTPVTTNFAEQKKLSIGNYIYLENNILIFSTKLKKTEFYKNPIFIRQHKIFQVKNNDVLTVKYPGNELISNDSTSGIVGVSFMKLLGLNSDKKELSFYELTNNLGKAGALCEIQKNRKVGLFLYDDFVILILKKVGSVQNKL